MKLSELQDLAGETIEVRHSLPHGASGPDLSRARYVIHTPHDGSEHFDWRSPAIAYLFHQQRDLLTKLLATDRDVGSADVGEGVIYDVDGGVQLVKRQPRGMLDTLRKWERATPIEIDERVGDDVRNSVMARLKDLYDQAQQGTNLIIGAVAPGSLWVDLHTMSPNSRTRNVKPKVTGVEPGDNNFADYIASWQEPVDERVNPRSNDVLTAMEDAPYAPVSDAKFVSALTEALKRRQIAYGLNKPYAFEEGILDLDYVGRRGLRGIAFDIIKPQVAVSKTPARFDLANLQVDFPGVNRMSAALAEAIKEVLGAGA